MGLERNHREERTILLNNLNTLHSPCFGVPIRLAHSFACDVDNGSNPFRTSGDPQALRVIIALEGGAQPSPVGLEGSTIVGIDHKRPMWYRGGECLSL